jgi:hypothetical protein
MRSRSRPYRKSTGPINEARTASVRSHGWEPRVGKRKILLPVVLGHVMPAGSNVIANVVLNRLVNGGHCRYAQPFPAEERIDPPCVHRAQELSFRVGTPIVLRARDIERTRSDQRQQFVAIDRQILRMTGVLFVVRTKPVREGRIQMIGGFTIAALQLPGSAISDRTP